MQQCSQCTRWKLYISIDYIFIQNDTLLYLPSNLTYKVDEYRIHNDTAYVCIPQAAQPPFYYIDLLYIVSWTLSSIALILALYLHWKQPVVCTVYDPRPLLCHMAALLGFYIVELFYNLGPHFSQKMCYFLAIWSQFTLRSAFCWLNVVTFDIWRHFHPQRIMTSSLRASCFKYTCQSLYAWGVPVLIIIICNLLIYMDVSLVPGYKARCLLTMYENIAQVVFFYGSISAILIVNIIFFILTCLNLRKFSMSVALANRRIHSQMLRMYMKLLIVTGVCWILEVVEWSTIPFKLNLNYWIVPDVLNALQGLFLFLIYNCNAKCKIKFKRYLFQKVNQVKEWSSIKSQSSSATQHS